MKRYLAVLGVSLSLVVMFSFMYSAIAMWQTSENNTTIVEVASISQNKEIQQKLKNLGYYSGSVDGILGPQSVAAIKKFQRDNGSNRLRT